MSDLRDILARTLVAQGALVEPIDPDGLEILAPPRVREALSLPEWSRVGFGAVLPEGSVRVSFESEWAQRLMQLLRERGTYVTVDLSTDPPPTPPPDLERELRHALVLENAIFRLNSVDQALTYYFLLVFHVVSTSDDKREDVVYLCMSESTGALADHLVLPLLERLREESVPAVPGPTQKELPLTLSGPRIRELATLLLPAKIRAKLAPFLAGMERRMSRDLERLHAYYTDLRLEAAARIEDRRRKGEDARVLEAEGNRLQAIEREYHAKVADLDRKYSMNVEIDLVQSARVKLRVIQANLALLRRKGVRKLQMHWTGLAKGFESFPCESCRAVPETYFVCDERLHHVCRSCMSACPACGREACRACHPGKCPKCGTPHS